MKLNIFVTLTFSGHYKRKQNTCWADGFYG